MHEYIEEFRVLQKRKSYADLYTPRIKKYVEFMHNNGYNWLDPEHVTNLNIDTYLISIDPNNLLSSSYKNGHILGIKKFYRLLMDRKYISREVLYVLDNIMGVKESITTPIYFNLEELKDAVKLMHSYYQGNPLKTDCMLYFLFFTGLRRTEFLSLRRENIFLSKNTAIVKLPNKNMLERFVYFPDNLSKLLQQFFSQNKETYNAFNVSLRSLTYRIDLVGKFLSRKITIHTFRHSHAKYLMSKDVEVTVAQKLMGHKHISSTMHYYRVPDDKIKSIVSDVYDNAM